jgi:hypothetical protein
MRFLVISLGLLATTVHFGSVQAGCCSQKYQTCDVTWDCKLVLASSVAR